MAVLLENDIFTFWCWILVIGRYAIMFRFGTRFLALTVYYYYVPGTMLYFVFVFFAVSLVPLHGD